MTAVEADPIYLYTSDRPSAFVGTVAVTSVEGPWSGSDRAVRLRFGYQPATPAVRAATALLYELAQIELTSDKRQVGRLLEERIAGADGAMAGRRPYAGVWLWYLSPEDVERVEGERFARGPSTVVLLSVRIDGVAADDEGAFGFRGEGQIKLGNEAWANLLTALGYTLPASVERIVGASLTTSPTWREAVEELKATRRLLAMGEDRAGLQEAYRHFDALARNPYRPASWREALAGSDLPRESVDMIAEMLAAHAQVLNKIARHPSDEPVGDVVRAMLPMDHWEAELLSAASHLLLAAARRWTSRERP